MPPIKVTRLGLWGVNVDKSPFELTPNEVIQAQNAIREPLGAEGGIKTRPGLDPFTTSATGDDILGGIGVLEPNQASGLFLLFVGRGGEV